MALEEESNSNTTKEEKTDDEIKKPSFKQMMEERKTVNRWFVMGVFVGGMFCGACLGVVFMWLAFVV